MHRWTLKPRNWGSSTNSCHLIVGHKNNSIAIVSRSQTFAFRVWVWLCKSMIRSTWWWACNSTCTVLATVLVPCLDIEAWRWAMPNLLIKLLRWDKSPRDTVQPRLSSISYMSQLQLWCVHCYSILHSIVPFHILVQRLETPIVVTPKLSSCIYAVHMSPALNGNLCYTALNSLKHSNNSME